MAEKSKPKPPPKAEPKAKVQPKPSGKQDSRKVHDTKGKNNHGRSRW